MSEPFYDEEESQLVGKITKGAIGSLEAVLP